MSMLWNLVVVAQILAALVMIGLVLIQHGKGADMGASFGSGASGSLFGATGSANFLSRSTAVCAGVFFACTLALAYFSNDRSRPATDSVLDRPAAAASAPLTGAAQVPGVPAVPAVPGAASAPLMAASPAVAVALPAASVPAVPAVTASGAGAVPAK